MRDHEKEILRNKELFFCFSVFFYLYFSQKKIIIQHSKKSLYQSQKSESFYYLCVLIYKYERNSFKRYQTNRQPSSR